MPQANRKQTQDIQSSIIKVLEHSPNIQIKLFSAFDDEMIRKYYPTKGAKALAKALGKERRQIINRASRLNVTRGEDGIQKT